MEMRYKAELRVNCRAIWGTGANDMDPDINHMVVHLQVALARFPGLEKTPAFRQYQSSKRSLKRNSNKPFGCKSKCEHTLSF